MQLFYRKRTEQKPRLNNKNNKRQTQICRGENKNKKRWVIDKGFGPRHINTRMTPNKTECILFSCFRQTSSFWYSVCIILEGRKDVSTTISNSYIKLNSSVSAFQKMTTFYPSPCACSAILKLSLMLKVRSFHCMA